jgi:hypothetical protein
MAVFPVFIDYRRVMTKCSLAEWHYLIICYRNVLRFEKYESVITVYLDFQPKFKIELPTAHNI